MAQDPSTIAARWAQNLGSATQKITDGVNAVTVAPGQAAARQKTVYLQNVQASVDKWAARTAAVPLESWKQDMINKGVQRIAQGATAAQPKFQSFMTALLPHIQSVNASLPARGNLDANINRMVAFTRGMAKFRYTSGS